MVSASKKKKWHPQWQASIRSLLLRNCRKWKKPADAGFFKFQRSLLLDLIHHSFESIRMIHSQISQYLSIELNALLRTLAHKFAIWHPVLTSTGIDSLNPEGSKLTFALLSTWVSIEKSLLYSVFGDGPNVFSGTVVPFGHLEDFFSARPRRDWVGCSWHF